MIVTLVLYSVSPEMKIDLLLGTTVFLSKKAIDVVIVLASVLAIIHIAYSLWRKGDIKTKGEE
ncbi:MAG: hypothetical protein QW506_04920 [Thermoproteota archaeon]